MSSKKGITLLLALAMVFGSLLIVAPAAAAVEVPGLIITKVAPDTDNHSNGGDAYELIEVYNTTAKDINLKGYNIIYAYSDDLADERNQFWSMGDVTIKSGDFVQYWVKQDDNDKTTAEFAANWGTTEDKVVIINAGGMANGSYRVLAIADAQNNEISRVVYNENGKDVSVGTGFVYGVAEEGGKSLVLLGSQQELKVNELVEGQAPAIVPAAMPQTGMGGTMPAESNAAAWTFGAFAAVVAGLAFFAVRRSAKQQ